MRCAPETLGSKRARVNCTHAKRIKLTSFYGSRGAKKSRARNAPGLDQKCLKILSLHGNVLFDHPCDRLFTGGAHHAFNFLAITEENQRGNAFDTVALPSR